MKILDLKEARKNPEQNPKQSINTIIADRLDRVTDKIGGVKNLFVSFTTIDKLGVNPSSKYDTPIGVYAYPAEYVMKLVGARASMSTLPFAGDAPYVNVFNASGNLVNVTNMSEGDSQTLLTKLISVVSAMAGVDSEKTASVAKDLYDQSGSKALVQTPGGKFWFVSYSMIKYLAELLDRQTPAVWSAVCRRMGIDGFVDGPIGKGVIHRNEPTQVVFFNTDSIKSNSRHMNRYSPEQVEHSSQRGQATRSAADRVAQMSESEAIEFFSDANHWDWIKVIKDREIRNQVIKNLPPEIIGHIPRPSETDQLVSLISSQGKSFPHIKGPSENAVVKYLDDRENKRIEWNALLTAFKPPGKHLQRHLVTTNYNALKWIDATPDVIKLAVATHVENIYKENARMLPDWLLKMAFEKQVDLSELRPRIDPPTIRDNRKLIAQYKEYISQFNNELKDAMQSKTTGAGDQNTGSDEQIKAVKFKINNVSNEIKKLSVPVVYYDAVFGKR